MNCRTQKAFLNICNTDNILKHILSKLNLSQQLELVLVSKRFADILTNDLWAKTYTHIDLYITPDVNIIISNNSQHNQNEPFEMPIDGETQPKEALTNEQLKHFLHLNAKNVNALKVFSEYHEKYVGIYFKNMKIFQNIRELTYYRVILNDEQMQVLPAECNKLQKLHLLECFCDVLKPLVPGKHFNLKYIYKMKELEELVIQANPLEKLVMKSFYLHDIFVNTKLRKLILRNITIYGNSNTTLVTTHNMEVLNVGIISIGFWPSFVYNLNHFIKLKELYVCVIDCNTNIDTQIIDILATKSTQLEKLCLEKCDLDVEDFGVLKTLKHLSLSYCSGLTFANFQQIMGGLKLHSFTLINTRLYGDIAHIYVSPSLEKIIIDTVRFAEISEAFKNSLNNFENLHTLIWYNGAINDDWILHKCPRLKTLHIPNPFLLKRIVCNLTSLKKLTFTTCNHVSWNFILTLIRMLALERLCLQTNEIISDDKVIPVNACGIRTTLSTIIMPYTIFRMAQSFWIDLLFLNRGLRYSIYGKHEELLDDIFLDELVCDEKFCHRVRWIKICGFELDCLDLQDNFNNALHQVNKYTSHYRFKKTNFTMEM